MARSEPTVNLQFCETHVIMKAILADGTVLRLGSATLTNVPEDGSGSFAYTAKIVKDSQVKLSTTAAADQVTLAAENVDKALGLTINDQSRSLVGAKVVCSKVFVDIQNQIIVPDYSPAVWFAADKLTGYKHNAVVPTITDLSGNGHDATATGSPAYMRRINNGKPALHMMPTSHYTLANAFQMSQVFAVFVSENPTFDRGSIIGSNTSGETTFQFASGTTQMQSPFPRVVRKNGLALGSPFNIGDIQQTILLNVKTNNPTAVRQYFLNRTEGYRTDFYLSELIGFTNDLNATDEQLMENYLANKYAVELAYDLPRAWDSKVLLNGEIAHVEATEEEVAIKIISDIAPNVAFISGRPVQTRCPLIFKGYECGYTGGLTTCNYLYESEGGCSGRQNQHRYGGVVIKGELTQIINGGVDTYIGDDSRDSGAQRRIDLLNDRVRQYTLY